MKKFLDGIKIGAGIMTFMLFFIIIGYYIVKARTGTTASPGDKLTASKWNELVANLSGQSATINTLQTTVTSLQTQLNSVKRVDVSLTDSNPFDTGCDRRFRNNNYFLVSYITLNGSKIFFPDTGNISGWQRVTVLSTEKNKRYYRNGTLGSSGLISKLQKRCQN